MMTSKTFATISYNTNDFLSEKLDKLIEDGVIDFYMWIAHAPEEDEKKGHKHLFIMPSTKINTQRIVDYLKEVDLKNPDKPPLGCLPCRASIFGDAYLYFLHDSAYLASKGMSRKYHYTHSDLIVSDTDFLHELCATVDRSKFIGIERVKVAVENGQSFSQLLQMGAVPIQLIAQYEKAYDYLMSNRTHRNGRKTHTPIVDEETGEIIKE